MHPLLAEQIAKDVKQRIKEREKNLPATVDAYSAEQLEGCIEELARQIEELKK